MFGNIITFMNIGLDFALRIPYPNSKGGWNL